MVRDTVLLGHCVCMQYNLSITTTQGPSDGGLCRQVVLILRYNSITEVVYGAAYSGLYRQVVFLHKWSLDAGFTVCVSQLYVRTVMPGLSGLELSRNLIYLTINSATLTISMYTNLPHLSSNLCYPTNILATNCVG